MAQINILKKRFLKLEETDPVLSTHIQKIETKLSVTFPDDFKEICQFHAGNTLGMIEHFHIGATEINPNILDETLRLRAAIGLPKNFVFLAEPPASVIFLQTENPSYVVWFDAVEIDNLKNGIPLTNPTMWENYAAFFEFLLDEEEEELKL